MKYFYLLFGLIPALLAGNPAFAQISIDEVDAKEDKVTFQDKLKSTSVDVDYFSLARYKAERAAIRKERNYLEFSGGIQGSLTSYNDPWISVSGGDNSIALTAVFGLRHLFTKNLFTLETKFNAKLGYNRMKVETTQKDDEGNEYTDSEGIWFKKPGRIRDFRRPVVQDVRQLVVRFDPEFPQPVRQRVQIAYGTKGGAPQEQIHDPGLPRHLARYHL